MTLQQVAESVWKIIPQFQSRDIPRTIEFYTKDLGFTLGGTYNIKDGQPRFCSVYAGHKAAANIYYFDFMGEREFQTSSAMIALGKQEVDLLYEDLILKGKVQMLEDIGDTMWGYRQFTIGDPDGNRITFFRFLEGENPKIDE
jgi:uncharacterized glyoxalase superfamily protein PhnB